MRHPRKLKIILIVLLDIVLIAILISCISSISNQSSRKTPSESQTNTSTPAPAKPLESEEDPEQLQDTASEGGTAAMPAESSHLGENGGEEPGNTSLPYYKEENAERYAQYQAENPDMSFEQVVTYVNIGLDKGFYEGVRPAGNTDSLDVLVNKFNKLPDDYKPELVKLPGSLCAQGVGEQFLRKEAAEALTKLNEDAKKEGLDIRAYGTYRSISTQNTIWNNAINSGRTREDVDSLNARGGHSEHHTGLAVDVIKNNYDVLDTPEYEWYKDKVHLYGFIIRYPEGKEHITGYKYEPWHLRYLGPELASAVYESSLTYDEYYAKFIE